MDDIYDEKEDAKKQKKARDWDDWKAENPAGTGNMNGR